MRKSLLIVSLSLFALVLPAPAFSSAKADISITLEEKDAAPLEYNIPADPTPSEETNTIQESDIARKMKQAKKAHDAHEYDSWGGGITIFSMAIVLGALLILSLLFYLFGNISEWFLKHKKNQTAKAKGRHSAETSETNEHPDSGEAIAAIAAALAQHFSADHDMEDTILTIRRMRKAYSPWNSKIYNMRTSPEISHHPVKIGK